MNANLIIHNFLTFFFRYVCLLIAATNVSWENRNTNLLFQPNIFQSIIQPLLSNGKDSIVVGAKSRNIFAHFLLIIQFCIFSHSGANIKFPKNVWLESNHYLFIWMFLIWNFIRLQWLFYLTNHSIR